MITSTITHVLLVPTLGNIRSVGLVIDDADVVWSDVHGLSAFDERLALESDANGMLVRSLAGTPLNPAEWQSVAARLDDLDLKLMPGLQMGVEQALVLALSRVTNIPRVALLADLLPGNQRPIPHRIRLILEAENHQATAQAIETMIALEPEGLGYRLSAGDIAGSIGSDAQYLQRFVRELGMVLDSRPLGEREPTLLYLGLQGALGELTADPRRDTGRVLGQCVGLETAAGDHPLWLEDPIVLDDEVAHTATLHQLREFMRSRGMNSRLIGRAYTNTMEGLTLLCETDAVDGVCLQVDAWGSLKELASAAELLHRAGKLAVLAISTPAATVDLAYYLDLAQALKFGHVLMGTGWGESNTAEAARLYLDRRNAWHDFRRQTPGQL